MKLIEALKMEKRLIERISDLQDKIGEHSAYLDFETPRYENQKEQVAKWVDSVRDSLRELEKLRFNILQTNLMTHVTIEIGDSKVTKPIQSWIFRRRELAKVELNTWLRLTDRNLREGQIQESTGNTKSVKIIRCYEPKQKDDMVSVLKEEPTTIDSALEVVNATTDLIEG